MFGFGKTKMGIDSFVNDQWIKLSSPERVSIWRAFVDQSNDEELKKVDLDKFCNCMLGAYAQVLGIAVMNTQSTDASLRFILYLGRKLEANNEAHKYWEEYNKSFGSDRNDGFQAMANTFQDMMMPLEISSETVDQIYNEFVQLLLSMQQVLERLKIVP
jgi:hypothetical protein